MKDRVMQTGPNVYASNPENILEKKTKELQAVLIFLVKVGFALPKK